LKKKKKKTFIINYQGKQQNKKHTCTTIDRPIQPPLVERHQKRSPRKAAKNTTN
jgi:hypothetical protein